MLLWAKITSEAVDIDLERLADDVLEETDNLIAHVFCHWDVLLRTLVQAKSSEGYHDCQGGQDIAHICGYLHFGFTKYVRDRHSSLGKCGKHAVR